MPIVESSDGLGWAFPRAGAWERTSEHQGYFWLNPSVNQEEHQLCNNCRMLNFYALFFHVFRKTPIEWRGESIPLVHGIRLGFLDLIAQNTGCRFCALVWKTFISDSLAHKDLLETDKPVIDFWLDNVAVTQEGTVDPGSRFLKIQGPTVVQLEISVREQAFAIDSSRPPGKQFSAFRIQQQVDFRPSLSYLPQSERNMQLWRLLDWVDACEDAHRQLSAPTKENSIRDLHERLQLDSRVIDVHRRRVVQAPKNCRYIALSYVWGGQNFETLARDNMLFYQGDGSIEFQKLPSTIRDAITLCRELGERYLWADSMCIPQDTLEKHAQIQHMETIYRGAALTIVAAAGSHADYGLPGLTAVPFKFQQHSTVIGNLLLTNIPPAFETSVDMSLWNTRSWTYQERLLSTRLIIFTKDEVYFQCDHGISHRGSQFNVHDRDRMHYLQFKSKHDERYRIQMERKVNFKTYAQIVQEYTSRNMSHVEDIENAFAGIKKIMTMLFGGSELLFGTPIACLDIALLWESRDIVLRRDEKSKEKRPPHRAATGLIDDQLFPTWSWVGWIGSVEFANVKNLAERTRSLVRWLDPLDKLKELPQENFGSSQGDTERRDRWLRQVATNDEVYYTLRGGDHRLWFCHPMEPFVHDPIPISRDTGTLHLEARIAQPLLLEPGPEGARRLPIISPVTRALAGFIIPDGRIDLAESSDSYALVRLSQTTLKEGTDDPAWDSSKAGYFGDPGGPSINQFRMDVSSAETIFDTSKYDPRISWCLYNVLLVQGLSDSGRVRRVGIGRVHILAFKEMETRTEKICIE